MLNKKRNPILTGCLCALGCESIFGFSYMFTKQATNVAGAFAFMGWRFLIAFLFMSLCILLGFMRVSFKGKSLKPLLLVALCNPAIYFTGETLGIKSTTAAESGVFLACIPVVSLIASSVLLHDKPTKTQVIGIAITLGGVILTVLAVSAGSSLSLTGYLFLVIAVISFALYAVSVRKAADFTEIEITYVMMIAGAIIFGILAFAEAGLTGAVQDLLILPFREPTFLIAILYQGIFSSVIGFVLSNTAISLIGVNRTSSFIGFSTVVSIAAGVIILGETFSMLQVAGAAVIIAGVYIANMKVQKQ